DSVSDAANNLRIVSILEWPFLFHERTSRKSFTQPSDCFPQAWHENISNSCGGSTCRLCSRKDLAKGRNDQRKVPGVVCSIERTAKRIRKNGKSSTTPLAAHKNARRPQGNR